LGIIEVFKRYMSVTKRYTSVTLTLKKKTRMSHAEANGEIFDRVMQEVKGGMPFEGCRPGRPL
jgi:hypothetical protein